MSAWNGLLLAEWFGATSGVGWRARYWYDANQLDGFLAWVLLFIAFLIAVNQALGLLEKRATRWRLGGLDPSPINLRRDSTMASIVIDGLIKTYHDNRGNQTRVLSLGALDGVAQISVVRGAYAR